MALALLLVLLVSLVAGLARVLRGPTPGDRMLAAQLFGTTGVATLLLLGQAVASPALRDVALAVIRSDGCPLRRSSRSGRGPLE